MHQVRKIVVFTSNPSWSVCAGIAAIAQAMPEVEWLIVSHAPPRRPMALLESQIRNLRRDGIRWLLYQARELLRLLFHREGAPVARGLPGYTRTLAVFGSRGRVERVKDIHAPETLDAIRAFAPDLGLSIAAPILRKALFTIPRLGSLNLHKGRLPDYRGMPPAFWELSHGERTVGCSVHWVDEKLDTGNIVAETTVPRERYSTLRGLQLRLDEVGIALMRQAVLDVSNGTARSRPQSPGGRTFRKPTLGQVRELERRLSRGEPRTERWLRRMAKEAAFAGGIALCFGPLRSVVARRITVLLYHSVNDEVRDNLTVGVEQFERQMRMLREHCVVRSVEEVIAMRKVPPTDKPQVCVTFDDGYLDNYVNAVPILERHGVPATFFVATGIVGTTRPFPHDIRRGRALPTMNWDQLGDMLARGFGVGSHSVTHIDCAAEPENVVVKELAQSLVDLKRELNLSRVMFAYPYGGREHMTSQRLALVKDAGFVGCLSAYGGSNVGTVDPFNVRRVNIHWLCSDRAFLFRCGGLA